MISAICAAVLAFLILAPERAEANPFDITGFGSRAQAMGCAFTAAADDFGAVYYNAAALVRGEGVTFGLEYFNLWSSLRINGESFEIDDSDLSGVAMGFSWIPKKRGRRLGIGIAIALPDQATIRARLLPPLEPRFVMINTQTQRSEALAAVAVEVVPGLSVGAGFSMIAALGGSGVRIDAALGSTEPVASADVEIRADMAPTAGLLFTPRADLSLGLAYRGQLDLTMETTTNALLYLPDGRVGMSDPGIMIGLTVGQDIFYSPNEIRAGCAYRPWERLLITADLAWYDWSKFPVPPTVDIDFSLSGLLSFLIEVPPELDPDLVGIPLKDTVVPRFGLEFRAYETAAFALDLRAGYAFEKSPVPEQEKCGNYLDNDRHIGSAGLGVSFVDPWGILYRPASIDFHFQYFHYESREHKKSDPTDPVGDIRSSGIRIGLGATLCVRF